MRPQTALLPIDMVASAILPSHPLDFQVDKLVGDREWGFVRFQCPVVLRERNGLRERPAGACMLYEPSAGRYYHAASGPLLHTWFLARGPGIAECIAAYGVPIHEAMPLGEFPFLETYIHSVRQERMERLPYWQDAITDLSYEFFRQLGGLLAQDTQSLTPARRRLVANLNEIRQTVHLDLARPWTVAEMAMITALNPTRFALDYSKEFGVSPMNDLINTRLRQAKHLLLHSSHPVKQVALECGFPNVEHFIRLFHKRIGVSPGAIRLEVTTLLTYSAKR